jgi:hypothetical protein
MNPNEQQILRKAYDQCLSLKRLLQAGTKVPDEVVTKAEELADAIYHYIVPKE